MLNRMLSALRHSAVVVLCAGLVPVAARGQDSSAVKAIDPIGKPRAQASRKELEASLVEIDKIMASTGYSSRIRDAKRQEAELIRQRLAEGDFRVGDQIVLAVAGESALSGKVDVAPGRVLVLPGLKDIPLEGVLRSEIQDYLTREIGKYVRDPQIRAQAMIRISVFGDVGKTGYYQMPADLLASDAIMQAGGPKTDQAPKRTVVRRAGREIVSRDVFQDAVQEGLTLDQLNLQAGDEISVGGKGKSFPILQILGSMGGIASTVYLFTRVF